MANMNYPMADTEVLELKKGGIRKN